MENQKSLKKFSGGEKVVKKVVSRGAFVRVPVKTFEEVEEEKKQKREKMSLFEKKRFDLLNEMQVLNEEYKQLSINIKGQIAKLSRYANQYQIQKAAAHVKADRSKVDIDVVNMVVALSDDDFKKKYYPGWDSVAHTPSEHVAENIRSTRRYYITKGNGRLATIKEMVMAITKKLSEQKEDDECGCEDRSIELRTKLATIGFQLNSKINTLRISGRRMSDSEKEQLRKIIEEKEQERREIEKQINEIEGNKDQQGCVEKKKKTWIMELPEDYVQKSTEGSDDDTCPKVVTAETANVPKISIEILEQFTEDKYGADPPAKVVLEAPKEDKPQGVLRTKVTFDEAVNLAARLEELIVPANSFSKLEKNGSLLHLGLGGFRPFEENKIPTTNGEMVTNAARTQILLSVDVQFMFTGAQIVPQMVGINFASSMLLRIAQAGLPRVTYIMRIANGGLRNPYENSEPIKNALGNTANTYVNSKLITNQVHELINQVQCVPLQVVAHTPLTDTRDNHMWLLFRLGQMWTSALYEAGALLNGYGAAPSAAYANFMTGSYRDLASWNAAAGLKIVNGTMMQSEAECAILCIAAGNFAFNHQIVIPAAGPQLAVNAWNMALNVDTWTNFFQCYVMVNGFAQANINAAIPTSAGWSSDYTLIEEVIQKYISALGLLDEWEYVRSMVLTTITSSIKLSIALPAPEFGRDVATMFEPDMCRGSRDQTLQNSVCTMTYKIMKIAYYAHMMCAAQQGLSDHMAFDRQTPAHNAGEYYLAMTRMYPLTSRIAFHKVYNVALALQCGLDPAILTMCDFNSSMTIQNFSNVNTNNKFMVGTYYLPRYFERSLTEMLIEGLRISEVAKMINSRGRIPARQYLFCQGIQFNAQAGLVRLDTFPWQYCATSETQLQNQVAHATWAALLSASAAAPLYFFVNSIRYDQPLPAGYVFAGLSGDEGGNKDEKSSDDDDDDSSVEEEEEEDESQSNVVEVQQTPTGASETQIEESKEPAPSGEKVDVDKKTEFDAECEQYDPDVDESISDIRQEVDDFLEKDQDYDNKQHSWTVFERLTSKPKTNVVIERRVVVDRKASKAVVSFMDADVEYLHTSAYLDVDGTTVKKEIYLRRDTVISMLTSGGYVVATNDAHAQRHNVLKQKIKKMKERFAQLQAVNEQLCEKMDRMLGMQERMMVGENSKVEFVQPMVAEQMFEEQPQRRGMDVPRQQAYSDQTGASEQVSIAEKKRRRRVAKTQQVECVRELVVGEQGMSSYETIGRQAVDEERKQQARHNPFFGLPKTRFEYQCNNDDMVLLRPGVRQFYEEIEASEDKDATYNRLTGNTMEYEFEAVCDKEAQKIRINKVRKDVAESSESSESVVSQAPQESKKQKKTNKKSSSGVKKQTPPQVSATPEPQSSGSGTSGGERQVPNPRITQCSIGTIEERVEYARWGKAEQAIALLRQKVPEMKNKWVVIKIECTSYCGHGLVAFSVEQPIKEFMEYCRRHNLSCDPSTDGAQLTKIAEFFMMSRYTKGYVMTDKGGLARITGSSATDGVFAFVGISGHWYLCFKSALDSDVCNVITPRGSNFQRKASPRRENYAGLNIHRFTDKHTGRDMDYEFWLQRTADDEFQQNYYKGVKLYKCCMWEDINEFEVNKRITKIIGDMKGDTKCVNGDVLEKVFVDEQIAKMNQKGKTSNGLFPFMNQVSKQKTNIDVETFVNKITKKQCKHVRLLSLLAMVSLVGGSNHHVCAVLLYISSATASAWAGAQLFEFGFPNCAFSKWIDTFSVLHDEVRQKRQINGKWIVSFDDQAQLMYIHTLYGRMGVEADWEDEKRKRVNQCAPKKIFDTMCGQMSEKKFDELLYEQIEILLRQSVATQRVQTFEEYAVEMYKGLASGSVAFGDEKSKELIKEVADCFDQEKESYTLLNKRTYMLTKNVGDVKNWLRLKPEAAAKAHTKGDDYAKRRALYAVGIQHYTIMSYVIGNIEKRINDERYVLQEGGSGTVKLHRQITNMCQSSKFMNSFDFSDFNAQHRIKHMQMIFDAIVRIFNKQNSVLDPVARDDYLRATEWIKKSYDNAWIEFPDGEKVKIISGLYSGDRATSFMNTVLNICYFNVVCEHKTETYGITRPIKSWHCGDDIVAAFETYEDCVNSTAKMTECGFLANEKKQLMVCGRAEFLRVMYYANGSIRAALNRSLVGTVCGTWESEVVDDPTARIQAIFDQLMMIRRRGAKKEVVVLLEKELTLFFCTQRNEKMSHNQRHKQYESISRFRRLSVANGGMGLSYEGEKITTLTGKASVVSEIKGKCSKINTPSIEDQTQIDVDRVISILPKNNYARKYANLICSKFEKTKKMYSRAESQKMSEEMQLMNVENLTKAAYTRKGVYRRLIVNIIKSTGVREVNIFERKIDQIMEVDDVIMRMCKIGHIKESMQMNTHLSLTASLQQVVILNTGRRVLDFDIAQLSEMLLYIEVLHGDEKDKMEQQMISFCKSKGLLGAKFDVKRPLHYDIRYDKQTDSLLSNESTVVYKRNLAAHGYKPMENISTIRFYMCTMDFKYDAMA